MHTGWRRKPSWMTLRVPCRYRLASLKIPLFSSVSIPDVGGEK